MAELHHRGGQGVEPGGAPVEQPAGDPVAAGGADGGGDRRPFRGWWTTIAVVAAVVAVVVAAGWRSSGGGGASGGVVGAEWSAQDAWAAQLESLRRELRAEQQRSGETEANVKRIQSELDATLKRSQSELEAALKRSQSEVQALRLEVAATKDVEAQLESLRKELRAEQQRFGEVEANLKRSQSEVQALRSEMVAKKDVEAQLESLRKELRAEQQRFGETEATVKRSQSELEATLKRSQSEVQALRSEVAATKDLDARLAVAERVARVPAVWTEQFRLAGHEPCVVSIVAHPTRPLLFSSALNGEPHIYAWDLSSRFLLRSLKGHEKVVFALALNPAGTQLASGSSDTTVRIWNYETGFCFTMTGHSKEVRSVVWSASGSLVASGSEDAKLLVWEAATGTIKHTLTGHGSGVIALASHPTEDLLASGSRDHTIRLWRWSTGEPVRTLKGHSSHVYSLVASSSFLVSGSDDKCVRVWSWTADASVRTLDGVVHSVWQNDLSWRNNTLVTLEAAEWTKPGATVRVWDTSAAHPKDWVLLGSLPSSTSSPFGVSLLSDGRVAWTGGLQSCSTISVWGV